MDDGSVEMQITLVHEGATHAGPRRLVLPMLFIGLIAVAATAGVVFLDDLVGPGLDPGPAPVGWHAWHGEAFAVALPATFDATVDLEEIATPPGADGIVLFGSQTDDSDNPVATVVVFDPGPGLTSHQVLKLVDDDPQDATMGSTSYAVGSPAHLYALVVMVSREGPFDLEEFGSSVASSFRSQASA